MSFSTQCRDCRHRIPPDACVAFPKGIPTKILAGEHDHRKPFPGDQGIRFKPV